MHIFIIIYTSIREYGGFRGSRGLIDWIKCFSSFRFINTVTRTMLFDLLLSLSFLMVKCHLLTIASSCTFRLFNN